MTPAGQAKLLYRLAEDLERRFIHLSARVVRSKTTGERAIEAKISSEATDREGLAASASRFLRMDAEWTARGKLLLKPRARRQI